jgi:hypothetical protein
LKKIKDMELRLYSARDINAAVVLDMASVGCTQEEIAQKFAVPIRVVINEYRKEYMQGIALMHEHLRRLQFNNAENGKKGDSTMLIFLGKCYLNQQEETTEEKLADLDLFLKYIENKDKCTNSQTSKEIVSPDQMPE